VIINKINSRVGSTPTDHVIDGAAMLDVFLLCVRSVVGTLFYLGHSSAMVETKEEINETI